MVLRAHLRLHRPALSDVKRHLPPVRLCSLPPAPHLQACLHSRLVAKLLALGWQPPYQKVMHRRRSGE